MASTLDSLVGMRPGDPFPSLQWQPVYDHLSMLGAWYSGDPLTLASYYEASVSSGAPADGRLSFWARLAKQTRASFVHVPVAGDIASMSASLLFSEAPRIEAVDAAGTPNDVVNARLTDILAMNNGRRLFREAAEVCAALGGVFLKIDVAPDVQPDAPLISVVHADAAFPSFRYGRLVRCIFWTVEEETETGLIRRMEIYEPGQVTTIRYRANGITLWGEQIGEAKTVPTGVPEISCVYIPNLRPHRLFRAGAGAWLGRADVGGLASLMDSLDEIYTDWLRDIQLAKGRVIASEQYFQRNSTDGTRYFDIDQQAYMGLPNVIGNEAASLKDQLVVHQFAIRAEEHQASYINTLRTIYSMAGYAPTSFGIDVQSTAESARALRTRDKRTYSTRNDKAQYWESGLADFLRLVLLTDNASFRRNTPVVPVRVTLSDSIDVDTTETAQSVELLRRAQAASTRTLVEMANPGRAHDTKWVESEVERIQQETGAAMPDPLQIGVA